MTTIRDANLDDPQRLVELFSDAYSGPSAKQAVPEAIWRDVDPLVRVREQLLGDLGMLVDRMSSPKNRMRVATRDHKVIGFAIWELDLKFDASTALGAGHRAEEPKKVTSKAVPGLNVALKQEVRDKIVAFQREVGARHGANECKFAPYPNLAGFSHLFRHRAVPRAVTREERQLTVSVSFAFLQCATG